MKKTTRTPKPRNTKLEPLADEQLKRVEGGQTTPPKGGPENQPDGGPIGMW